MTALAHIALSNAMTVLPLALLAWLVSRIVRRPALAHALWLLVLVKLITPPLFVLPLSVPLPVAADLPVVAPPDIVEYRTWSETAATVAIEQPNTLDSTRAAPVDSNARTADSAAISKPAALSHDFTGAASDSIVLSMVDSSLSDAGPTDWLKSCLRRAIQCWQAYPIVGWSLLTVWLCGSIAWLSSQIARAIAFYNRVVRHADPCHELQQHVVQLGLRLGLRRVPHVLLADATISPMLWGCGRQTRLLFPVELAGRLSADARAALLTHELAHFSRGDQWVRVLELVTSTLFWWHPVVWWARREIEQSEEECCDAWVVTEFPQTPRRYAEALLDTIDFLCDARLVLPPVASGLGDAIVLRRRLTKIMRGVSPKSLSQRVRCGVAVAAALLLPLQPFVFGASVVPQLLPPSGLDWDIATSADSEDDPTVPNMSNATPAEIDRSPSPSAEEDVTKAKTVDRAAMFADQTRARRGEKSLSTATSPDGRFVVRTTTGRRVVLSDRLDNRETELSGQSISGLAFSPNGLSFVTVGTDGRVAQWDSAEGRLTRIIHTQSDALRTVCVSPQSDCVAIGGSSGAVLIIGLTDGGIRLELPLQPAAVNCVRFSPDGQWLAVAVGDWHSDAPGRVTLFNLQAESTEATLPAGSAVGAVAFASDRELIVGLWDGHADLWNLESQQIVGTGHAHKDLVAAAAFSPDNPSLRGIGFVATPLPGFAPVPRRFQNIATQSETPARIEASAELTASPETRLGLGDLLRIFEAGTPESGVDPTQLDANPAATVPSAP